MNFLLSVVCLLQSGRWQRIIGVVGLFALVTCSLCTVAAGAFRAAAPERPAGWMPGLRRIVPLGFAVAAEFVSWSSWSSWQTWRVVLPLLLGSVLLFALPRHRQPDPRAELRRGAWLLGRPGRPLLPSGLGTFGGAAVVPVPWDRVGVVLCTYRWAVRSGTAYPSRIARPW